MAQLPDSPIDLAKELREKLAGTRLLPSFAKLYSQHSRLREGQPGLAG